jgi:type I restriction enzyme S subunit
MKESGIEWIGQIPEHWEVRKLSRILSFKGGFAFNSDDFKEEGNKQVVRIGNIRNDLLRLNISPVYISNNIALQAKNAKLEKGQILFTMTGTKGKRDYFYTLLLKDQDFENRDLYLNQRVGCFVKKDDARTEYYNYLLKDKNILDSIFIYETGTANQGNLGIETIKRTMLQYPPISEQQSIADYLDEKCSNIDSLINIKQQKIEELKDYKKSIIYEYVTGKKEVED